MIDFHTHILPGIDDGSRDIRMTEQMLEKEAAMGVTHIYATPHFYAHRANVTRFLEKREKSLQKVKELLETRDGLPAVSVGAEVYYFAGMGKAEHTPQLCVEGTDVLLVEMPFEQWTDQVYRDVTELVMKRRLRVVLAHVERYIGMQKDREIWDSVMELPLTIQMNAGSFLKFGLTRRFCMNLLKEREGKVIIGSDCHNLTSRPPNVAQAMEYIRSKTDADTFRNVEETAAGICR